MNIAVQMKKEKVNIFTNEKDNLIIVLVKKRNSNFKKVVILTHV